MIDSAQVVDIVVDIVVTVIATGFNEEISQPKQTTRPSFGQPKPVMNTVKREQPKREEVSHEPVRSNYNQQSEDALDIPTFLRNRNRRR